VKRAGEGFTLPIDLARMAGRAATNIPNPFSSSGSSSQPQANANNAAFQPSALDQYYQPPLEPGKPPSPTPSEKRYASAQKRRWKTLAKNHIKELDQQIPKGTKSKQKSATKKQNKAAVEAELKAYQKGQLSYRPYWLGPSSIAEESTEGMVQPEAAFQDYPAGPSGQR
jgi:hypothetical protein